MLTQKALGLGEAVWGFSVLVVVLGGCTAPPSVISTIPANGATGVPINMKIAAIFNERMAPAQLNTNTFLLQQGTTPVAGAVAGVNATAVFTPASDLIPNTLYTATITTGAENVAGDPLPQNYVWTFTAGTTRDITPPAVESMAPGVNAVGVIPTTNVTVNFSKAMDPLTITTGTFILAQGAIVVAGSVSSSDASATFNPINDLAPFTTYTVTITTAVADLAGNGLAQDFVGSFTTGAAPDVTPPTIVQVIPADGAVNVPINATIAATFSETVDAPTVSTATFLVDQGGTPVTGTVTLTGTTAIFMASGDLAPNATYTVTITTEVTDLAGNALASDVVWTFATGPAPDTTIPAVVLVSPPNAATDVPITTTVSATFSEAMAPLTITAATFVLLDPASVLVAGTVTYDATTNTATFTPAGDLALNAPYTAMITTGVTDLRGNHLANNFVWSFTTSIAAF